MSLIINLRKVFLYYAVLLLFAMFTVEARNVNSNSIHYHHNQYYRKSTLSSSSINNNNVPVSHVFTANKLSKIRGGARDLPQSSAYWSTSSTSRSSGSANKRSSQNNYSNRSSTTDNIIDTTTDTTTVTTDNLVDTKETIDAFLTRDNRNTFIARVYMILSTQLLVTAMSIFAFATYPHLATKLLSIGGRSGYNYGRFVPMICLLTSTISASIMSASESARQSSPTKWKLLSLFTLGEAIVVGLISSFYKSKTIISAFMSTMVALLSVTFYTLCNKNPKYDLSTWGNGLYSSLMIFIFYGIIHTLSVFGILPPNFLPYQEVLYSMVGTILFTTYLAYHTRLIVSGKHTKYQLNHKDYVFGAVLLYSDIINIFLYLLRLLEDRNDE